MAGVLDVTRWELRPWDSEFFGIRVAQISRERSTEEELALTVEQARQASIDLLYFLADAGDPETLRAADGNGFELMDVRVTLERPIEAVERDALSSARDDAVRPARPEDLSSLQALARVSHRNTRFGTDPRFAPGRSDELYALWIERSVRAELADAVLVIDVESAARGYITLSAGTASATIGLVAVAAEYRGRGYGERLLRSALRWTVERGLTHVSVVTQGRSAASLRFYERAGFTTSLVQFWYHRWL